MDLVFINFGLLLYRHLHVKLNLYGDQRPLKKAGRNRKAL